MQKESIKFENSTVLEGMTSLRALFIGQEKNINDRKIETVYYAREREEKNKKELAFLRAKGKDDGFLIEPLSEDGMSSLTLGSSHGGIVARCTQRTLPCLETALIPQKNGFYVMIEGIEDPYNFGYALRSLYACGIDGVILGVRNWMSAAGVVARASAGASEMLPIYVAETKDAIPYFKQYGYQTVCADERTDCILGKTAIKKPVFLLVGGEKRGISRAVLDRADLLVKIPYAVDFHASLSAASAATILGYEIMKQNM